MTAPLLSSGELARLAAISRALMTETATIVRPGVATRSASGGRIPGVATTTTSPCRRRPVGNSARLAETGLQLTPSLDWLLSFPLGTDVRPTDEVVIGGDTYDVTALLTPHTTATSVRLVARKRP